MRYKDDPYVPNIRSERNARMEAEIKEYDEQRAPKDEEVPEEKAPAGTTGWEKRYADLRSHSQKKENELNNQLQTMQRQIEKLTKEEIKFPKSDEEFEEWAGERPEVVAMIETLVLKKMQGVREELTQTREEIDAEKLKGVKLKAWNDLLAAHPDFPEIRETEEFHTWAEDQDEMIRDALYKNETNARAAIAAVKLYKADTKAPSKKDTQTDVRDAARGVKSTKTAPASDNLPVYSESKLKAMDRKDYTPEVEAAYDKAMREGRFVYDISYPNGAAR